MKIEIKADLGTSLGFSNSGLRKNDEFLPSLISIFTFVRWMGIPPYGGTISFYWGLLLFGFLVVLELGAIWKLIRLIAGIATNTDDGRGIVARMSGSIFYGNAVLSHILCWRVISSFKSVSMYFTRAETAAGFYLSPDPYIRRKVIGVTCFVALCAFLEHALSMISATGFDVPPGDYFRLYILSSHGFLLQPHEYSLWVGIPIFILSKLATILWNFQDLIVILISMGLTSRYHRLNLFVNDFVKLEKKDRKRFGTELYSHVQTWRRVREAYVRQAALVRRIDRKIGKLILLCNMNNFYFICLQLFLGINQNLNLSVINKAYYFYSMGWLLLRASSVVLAAADVNVYSRRALSCLYCCPASSYNVEIKRLENQLTHDYVALSGLRLFYLDRQLLLEVAAAILKYELVMIQYDKQ